MPFTHVAMKSVFCELLLFLCDGGRRRQGCANTTGTHAPCQVDLGLWKLFWVFNLLDHLLLGWSPGENFFVSSLQHWGLCVHMGMCVCMCVCWRVHVLMCVCMLMCVLTCACVGVCVYVDVCVLCVQLPVLCTIVSVPFHCFSMEWRENSELVNGICIRFLPCASCSTCIRAAQPCTCEWQVLATCLWVSCKDVS